MGKGRNMRIHRDKKYEEWENSIEGIHYDLAVFGEALITDEHNSLLICKVLQRLPKKTREKVLEEVIFIHTTAWGTIHQLHFQEHIKDRVIIIFNFKCIKKDETKMDTIAHEIAHYILGHYGIVEQDPNDERAADDLVEKWGFGRAYKTYKQFEKSSTHKR